MNWISFWYWATIALSTVMLAILLVIGVCWVFDRISGRPL